MIFFSSRKLNVVVVEWKKSEVKYGKEARSWHWMLLDNQVALQFFGAPR